MWPGDNSLPDELMAAEGDTDQFESSSLSESMSEAESIPDCPASPDPEPSEPESDAEGDFFQESFPGSPPQLEEGVRDSPASPDPEPDDAMQVQELEQEQEQGRTLRVHVTIPERWHVRVTGASAVETDRSVLASFRYQFENEE